MKLNKHEESAWDQFFSAAVTVDYSEFKDREVDLEALSHSEKKQLLSDLIKGAAELADLMIEARRERL